MEHLSRPGCFGLVVCYEPKSDFCGACNLITECGQLAAERRDKLAGLLAGVAPRKRAGSPISSPASPGAPVSRGAESVPTRAVESEVEITTHQVGVLSKKAQELQISLDRFGYGNTPDLLRAGTMPLQGINRFKYFRIACQALLSDGYLDRHKLKETFMRELNWNEQTASSHLSIVASYMVGTGVVTADGDRFIRVARP